MLDAFFASVSTVALLSVVAWLARTWIKERLAASLKLEVEQKLEEIKSKHAKQVALTDSRVSAYKDLWEITEKLSPRGRLELNQDQLNEYFEEYREWYYTKGNALHLSIKTANDFLKGLQYLEQKPTEENLRYIQRIFSSVRTRIKEDLGVYNASDVSKSIPDYREPLVNGTKLPKPMKDA